MRKLLVGGVALAVLSLGMSACTPNISPDVVQASDANSVQTAVEGVIVSKRVVTVKGNNAIGTLAGAGLGAIAGSAVGGGDRVPLMMGIVGGLAGGAAGNAIEDKMTTQKGIEYVVRLAKQDSGETTIKRQGYHASTTTVSSQSSANRYVNVIQGQGEQVLQVGQKVLVAGVNSGHAHIISTL